ncbi:helix-turn-helix domain-containing protein [Litorisediminicola beolgyonensis]|uniref:Helix-turn-helix domain-containing protein n=2 Tax=Litorisediminicola beolgyonensis TaxID=1173614 RepID=A0ABW3ZH12_9RHOB
MVFGENLRHLSARAESISALCRALGINRTQFNRYLTGESFPRPDILYRICQHFDTDARILLEPLHSLGDEEDGSLFSLPFLKDFAGSGFTSVNEMLFPVGFYRFSRVSFFDPGRYTMGLVRVHRDGDLVMLRGFEAKEATSRQGLPTAPRTREYRGLVIAQEGGISIIASRRNALTSSYSFLSRAPSFENNHWVGYATRTVAETSLVPRVTRLVYEHLGHDTGKILAAARKQGIFALEELPAYHRTQLKPNEPFA